MQPKLLKWWLTSCSPSNLNLHLSIQFPNQLLSIPSRTIKSRLARLVKVLTSKAHRTFSISSTNSLNQWWRPKSRFRLPSNQGSYNLKRSHHQGTVPASRTYQRKEIRSLIRSSITTSLHRNSRLWLTESQLPHHLTLWSPKEQALLMAQAPMTILSMVYLKGRGLLKKSSSTRKR
jgi:hypothetical protein